MFKIIRERLGVTSYGLWRALRRAGVEITQAGVDAYERKPPRSMRLDVLCALKRISGMSWEELGKELEKEFGLVDERRSRK